MTSERPYITVIGTGLYVVSEEPGKIYVSPAEILANKGIPATQETCAAVYAAIAIGCVDQGLEAVLIQTEGVMSTEETIKQLLTVENPQNGNI